MSLENKPKTYKDWLTKAGQFFDVTQRLKKLCSGNHSYIPFGGYQLLPSSYHDLNAMNMDVIQLSPTQRAENMHNNKYFIYYKVRCCTNKHPCSGNQTVIQSPHPLPSPTFVLLSFPSQTCSLTMLQSSTSWRKR